MENFKIYIITAIVLVFLSVVITLFGDEIDKWPHVKSFGARRLNGLLDFIYVLIFTAASIFALFITIGNKLIKILKINKKTEEDDVAEKKDDLDISLKNSRKHVAGLLIFCFIILPFLVIIITLLNL